MTPFNWQQHLRETAVGLVNMASEPGWQAHAKFRRDELLADPLYGEALRVEIKRVMRERESASPSRSAQSPSPTSASIGQHAQSEPSSTAPTHGPALPPLPGSDAGRASSGRRKAAP